MGNYSSVKSLMDKYWFKKRSYGWGWTPSTWQGWLVTLVYIALLVGIFIWIDNNSHSVSDTLYGVFIPFVALTSVMMVVSYWKGEKPRWSWRYPNREQDK